MEIIESLGWVRGSIECAPPDPDAGDFVWITFDVPGQPRQVIKLLPEFFPDGSALDETRSLQIRFVNGVPEVRFTEPFEVTAEVRAAASLRACDIAEAGGGALLTNSDLDRGLAVDGGHEWDAGDNIDEREPGW
jgi:hypothetical protein